MGAGRGAAWRDTRQSGGSGLAYPTVMAFLTVINKGMYIYIYVYICMSVYIYICLYIYIFIIDNKGVRGDSNAFKPL